MIAEASGKSSHPKQDCNEKYDKNRKTTLAC
jgi:hypothetical protein